MPVDKQVHLRYLVLHKCFRNKYRNFTIDDLVYECNKAMRRLGKADVSKRTILYDINEMEMPPYSIRLDENLKLGRKRIYRYVDTDYELPMFSIDDEERNKLLDAIDVLEDFEGEPLYDWARTLLKQIEGGVFSISSPIVSFQSNPDLVGIEHFESLLNAIVSKKVLQIRYAPFGKRKREIKIYPYHLKQYNDRWYLIAQELGYSGYATYPLDRIESFRELNSKYKESDENFEEYFDDVIGITVPDCEPIDITLKVSSGSMGYVLTKPLHLSQHTIEKTNEYVIISINVKPNYELDSKILSFGPSMEVLSPESYREHISGKIQCMNKIYSNYAENLHSK